MRSITIPQGILCPIKRTNHQQVPIGIGKTHNINRINYINSINDDGRDDIKQLKDTWYLFNKKTIRRNIETLLGIYEYYESEVKYQPNQLALVNFDEAYKSQIIQLITSLGNENIHITFLGYNETSNMLDDEYNY